MLTVYGIETIVNNKKEEAIVRELQQCLPFTVLKPSWQDTKVAVVFVLQQCLPFTVLKLFPVLNSKLYTLSCNSAYRLRY